MTAATEPTKDAREGKAKRHPRTLTYFQRTADETPELTVAGTALMPAVQAAISQYAVLQQHFGGVELDALVRELRGQADAVEAGSLRRMENMLVAQAHTLDVLFNRLVERAAAQIVEHPQALEIFLKLAYRAQSNCRATVEALAEIKTPKSVAFVRQANIANGPQQVNNGPQAGVNAPVRAPAPAAARAGEFEMTPSKLLEQTDGERLDAGTAGATAVADTDLVPVGAINGT